MIMNDEEFANSLDDEQKQYLCSEALKHAATGINAGYYLKDTIASGNVTSGVDVTIATANAAIAIKLFDIGEIDNPFKETLEDILEFTQFL